MDLLRQEMAEELLDAFGVDATYRYQDGTLQGIKVRYERDVEIMDDSNLSLLNHVIGINPDDVAAPALGETVTIAGRDYVIGRRIDRHGGLDRYEVA